MRHISRLGACASAAFALCGFAAAQSVEFFGRWEDSTQVSLELYVSPTGSNSNSGTTPTSPLRTITAALSNGAIGSKPVTINLLPGTYGAGETYPLRVPAHGVALEANYLKSATVTLAPDTDVGGAPSIVIDVSKVGNSSLPDSVIRGIEVVSNGLGTTLIHIAPPSTGGTGPDSVAVEIRDCFLHGLPDRAIEIVGAPGLFMHPLIEHNDIIADTLHNVASRGVVLWGGASNLGADGLSSPLLRSNRIINWVLNVDVLGVSQAACRPRVFSNFIESGRFNLQLQQCNPIILNNTVAFANADGQPEAWGMLLSNVGTITVANNLFWNPDHTSPNYFGTDVAFTPPAPAIALNVGNVSQDPPNSTTNLQFPQIGTVAFVGGSTPLPSGLNDLHLLPTSTQIDAGNLAAIAGTGASGALTATVTGAAGTRIVRIDVSADVDDDSRILAGSDASGPLPDIGADEFAGSLRLLPNAAGTSTTQLDRIGNLTPVSISGSTLNYTATLDVRGNPGDVFALFLGSGYFDTVNTPSGLVENSSLFENTISPFANRRVDTSASNTAQVASGVIPASGVATVTFNFPAVTLAMVEAEFFAQAELVNPTTQSGRWSNRLLIELGVR